MRSSGLPALVGAILAAAVVGALALAAPRITEALDTLVGALGGVL